MHFLLLVLFLLVGFAITTTVRTQATDPLAGLNEDQLVTLLSDLDQREQNLRNERRELQAQISDLEEAADAQQTARDAVAQATQRAEIAAGSIPVEGPGVILNVGVPEGRLPVSVFVTTLAELRNTGAESISINGVRLNARAWFGRDENDSIVASGTVLQPPYEWRAIGDSSTLAVALEIRGGAASQYRAYGATVLVQTVDDLQITAVVDPPEPVFAQPVTN
ncbi:DUF881 domain-containing protein [Actinomyces minihominis]|uniref:DUF881 domain-containing protein n=1 Tax=Actinomyces minihominis TaxID=2002838 RepID=UPI0013EAE785|nr:DUF881 domain-containing protein [Actinomyces minihominis]